MPQFARLSVRLLMTILSAVAAAASAADTQYTQEIDKWRAEFDADIRTGGWLLTVGRVKVREGTSTVGASPDSGIVLPARSPARAGALIRRGEQFDFEPADGATVSIDERVVTGRTALSTGPGSGKIAVGGLSLAVRRIADDFYLNIENPSSPALAEFKGSTWFRIDPSYRVAARFLPYEKPEEVVLALTFENASKPFTATGDVAFLLAGQAMKLKAFVDDDQLFLIFQDETNGVETYGGGRFLYAPMPRDGLTTLDFNKAFNPYCAVNPNVLCPVCPAGNRLPARIVAGATIRH